MASGFEGVYSDMLGKLIVDGASVVIDGSNGTAAIVTGNGTYISTLGGTENPATIIVANGGNLTISNCLIGIHGYSQGAIDAYYSGANSYDLHGVTKLSTLEGSIARCGILVIGNGSKAYITNCLFDLTDAGSFKNVVDGNSVMSIDGGTAVLTNCTYYTGNNNFVSISSRTAVFNGVDAEKGLVSVANGIVLVQ